MLDQPQFRRRKRTLNTGVAPPKPAKPASPEVTAKLTQDAPAIPLNEMIGTLMPERKSKKKGKKRGADSADQPKAKRAKPLPAKTEVSPAYTCGANICKYYTSMGFASAEDRKARLQLCAQLERELHRFYSGAKLYISGSTLSDLFHPLSDLDLVVELPPSFDSKGQIQNVADSNKGIRSFLYSARARLGLHSGKVIIGRRTILQLKEPFPACPYELDVGFGTDGIESNHYIFLSYFCNASNPELWRAAAERNGKVAGSTTMVVSPPKHASTLAYLLTIAVKRWGLATKVLDSPGQSFSSFAFILMVIYFLQRRSPPVLPIIPFFKVSAEEAAQSLRNRCLQPNASRALHKDVEAVPKDLLGSLYKEFFEFYANFDNQRKIVDVTSAADARVQPMLFTGQPIVISHPAVPQTNVCANVTNTKFAIARVCFESWETACKEGKLF